MRRLEGKIAVVTGGNSGIGLATAKRLCAEGARVATSGRNQGLGKAKVAAARKRGIRVWILLRDPIDYQEFCRRGQLRQKCGGAHAGVPAREHDPA
jgi:NAD(P)-dependent dehydrogenase (short-subunit alcohol dehydrogenase family)